MLLAVFPAMLFLAGCNDEPAPAEKIRPARTVVVDPKPDEDQGTLTGEIQARYQSDLGFRIDGKVIARLVDVGASVSPGDVLARLDDSDERNRLRSAQADVAAARADLANTEGQESRQRTLLKDGFTTQARYDDAQRALKTTQAKLDSAEAGLRTGQDRVAYSTLRADEAGIVTAIGAEPGQVVTAGRMVVRVAKSQEKDAVFNVSEQIMRNAPSDPPIEVTLLDDPAVSVAGKVREVAPSADPATHTYTVKVALTTPPPQMMLGSAVVGRVRLGNGTAVSLPASALFSRDNRPAVWIVDPANSTVDLKPVTVLRYDTATVVISGGLQKGERVVTAGVQKMRPGLKVRLLEGATAR